MLKSNKTNNATKFVAHRQCYVVQGLVTFLGYIEIIFIAHCFFSSSVNLYKHFTLDVSSVNVNDLFIQQFLSLVLKIFVL